MDQRMSVQGLVVDYGGPPALRGVDLSVDAGKSIAILGANGAGKTTLLRTLAGELSETEGTITLRGRRIPPEPNWRRVDRGVVLAPEGHPIISTLTVEENLRLGAVRYWPRKHADVVKSDLPHVFDLFPRLADRRKQTAGSLSGGEQQMLSIGRALMARPEVLLMDEPSLGLAPVIVESIVETLIGLRGQGLSIILAEQNSDVAQEICEYMYVLRLGEVVRESPSGGIDVDQLRSAYFFEDPR